MDNSNIYINADALKARIMASPIFRNFGEDGEFIKDFVLAVIDEFKEKDYVKAIKIKKWECKENESNL